MLLEVKQVRRFMFIYYYFFFFCFSVLLCFVYLCALYAVKLLALKNANSKYVSYWIILMLVKLCVHYFVYDQSRNIWHCIICMSNMRLILNVCYATITKHSFFPVLYVKIHPGQKWSGEEKKNAMLNGHNILYRGLRNKN